MEKLVRCYFCKKEMYLSEAEEAGFINCEKDCVEAMLSCSKCMIKMKERGKKMFAKPFYCEENNED